MVLNKINKIIVAKALPALNTHFSSNSLIRTIRLYNTNNRFVNKVYPVSNILSKEVLEIVSNSFYKEIVNKINDNQHIDLIFKVRFILSFHIIYQYTL